MKIHTKNVFEEKNVSWFDQHSYTLNSILHSSGYIYGIRKCNSQTFEHTVEPFFGCFNCSYWPCNVQSDWKRRNQLTKQTNVPFTTTRVFFWCLLSLTARTAMDVGSSTGSSMCILCWRVVFIRRIFEKCHSDTAETHV